MFNFDVQSSLVEENVVQPQGRRGCHRRDSIRRSLDRLLRQRALLTPSSEHAHEELHSL